MNLSNLDSASEKTCIPIQIPYSQTSCLKALCGIWQLWHLMRYYCVSDIQQTSSKIKWTVQHLWIQNSSNSARPTFHDQPVQIEVKSAAEAMKALDGIPVKGQWSLTMFDAKSGVVAVKKTATRHENPIHQHGESLFHHFDNGTYSKGDLFGSIPHVGPNLWLTLKVKPENWVISSVLVYAISLTFAISGMGSNHLRMVF